MWLHEEDVVAWLSPACEVSRGRLSVEHCADRLPMARVPECLGHSVLDLGPSLGLDLHVERPQEAANAVSFGGDDGLGSRRRARRGSHRGMRIAVPSGPGAADERFFLPSCRKRMASLYIGERLLCIRSWQRRVFVTAVVRVERDERSLGPLQGLLSLRPSRARYQFDAPISDSQSWVVGASPAPRGEAVYLQSVVMDGFPFGANERSLRHNADLPPARRPGCCERSRCSTSRLRAAIGRKLRAVLAGVPSISLHGSLSALTWPGIEGPGMLRAVGKGLPGRRTFGEGGDASDAAVQADRLDDVSLLLDRGADPTPPMLADIRLCTGRPRQGRRGWCRECSSVEESEHRGQGQRRGRAQSNTNHNAVLATSRSNGDESGSEYGVTHRYPFDLSCYSSGSAITYRTSKAYRTASGGGHGRVPPRVEIDPDFGNPYNESGST